MSEAMQKAFKIGHRAVYPGHGVGEITAIEQRDFAGIEQTFYVLHMLGTGMNVLVPTNNVRHVGMRAVIGEDKLDKVFDVLRDETLSVGDKIWNRRQRQYGDMLKTGSLVEVAKVFRDLRVLGMRKELSFVERRVLDKAQTLLVGEVACAKQCTVEDATQQLEKLFPRKLLSAA